MVAVRSLKATHDAHHHVQVVDNLEQRVDDKMQGVKDGMKDVDFNSGIDGV